MIQECLGAVIVAVVAGNPPVQPFVGVSYSVWDNCSAVDTYTAIVIYDRTAFLGYTETIRGDW